MELESRISIVSKFYVARSPEWQLPQSAELLCSDPSVHSDSGHFFETTTALVVPFGILVVIFRLEPAVPNMWLFLLL